MNGKNEEITMTTDKQTKKIVCLSKAWLVIARPTAQGHLRAQENHL